MTLQRTNLFVCYESRGGSSDFWLPTSDFWLPTSDFRLPISDFRLPISLFWFPTSDFWHDSSVSLDCRSIHHAGINAQSQSSVERTAVPFSPQKRTTKLALEKATKQLLPRKEIPAPVTRLEKHLAGIYWVTMQFYIIDAASLWAALHSYTFGSVNHYPW